MKIIRNPQNSIGNYLGPETEVPKSSLRHAVTAASAAAAAATGANGQRMTAGPSMAQGGLFGQKALNARITLNPKP